MARRAAEEDRRFSIGPGLCAYTIRFHDALPNQSRETPVSTRLLPCLVGILSVNFLLAPIGSLGIQRVIVPSRSQKVDVGKSTLLLLGSYAISVGIAVSCLFVTVGITSGWGAGRTGDAMMWMLAVIVGVFLVSTLIVFMLLSYFIPNLAGRIFATLGYGGLSFATVLLIALMSAIVLNR